MEGYFVTGIVLAPKHLFCNMRKSRERLRGLPDGSIIYGSIDFFSMDGIAIKTDLETYNTHKKR